MEGKKSDLKSDTTTHESDHVYLAISPNPVWGNYTAASTYEIKNGEKFTLPKPERLHFLKVGDEVHFGDRISEYNTHNPQIWFHYIVFSDYKDNKQKRLGTEIEGKFENFQRSKSSNEWLLIWNAGKELKDLCEIVLKYGVANKKAVNSKYTFDYVEMTNEDDLINALTTSEVTQKKFASPGQVNPSEEGKGRKKESKDEKVDRKKKGQGMGRDDSD